MKNYSDIITDYKIKLENYRKEYIDFPQLITFETYTKCNASCYFCPYKNLKRKGTKLSNELINKIILEMKDIPSDLPIRVVPERVNEPFLDKRIIDICTHINEKIKNAQIEFYSNGSMLIPSIFKKLLKLSNISILGISLNYFNKMDYENIMKLSFHKTIQNIDRIHTEYINHKLPFNIVITSVSNGQKNDEQFLLFASSRWPRFSIHILPKGDWIHELNLPNCDLVPDIGCGQWFSVNFLSDGKEAFCCIDSEGKYASGDINSKHLLDIYNHSKKRTLRESLPSRKDVKICDECSFLLSKIIMYGKNENYVIKEDK